MTPEVKQAVEELGKAFHDFREANDKRLALIEKTGTELPEARAEVDKANARITELQAAMDKHAKQIGRLTAGGGVPGTGDPAKDIQAARLWIAAKTGKPVEAVDETDVERYTRYRAAHRAYLRRGGANGEMLTEGIRAELSVGSDPDGGYWVPTETSQTVIQRLFETSDVRAVAGQTTITTDALEMPTDTNSSTSGGWVAEKGSRTETATPQVGVHRIVVHEQYAEPHATQKLLDDAAIDVEGWLAGKTADILGRTENTAFVSGTGVGQPRGFLDYRTAAVTTDDDSRNWGVLQYVVSGASGGFPTVSGIPSASDTDALITLISKLKPIYRPGAIFAMNRAAEAEIRKLKDGDGRYLVGMGDLRDSATGFSLLGFPIRTMEDMPDIGADSFSVVFGNFRMGYMIVDRQGIRVLRDPYTNKPFVKFYTTRRVGGDVINFDALKLLKFGTS